MLSVAANVRWEGQAVTKARTKGRDGKRDIGKISFHSFRYTTGGTLRSMGVSEEISMDILGHETEAVHRHYSKASIEAKREALNKLPEIGL